MGPRTDSADVRTRDIVLSVIMAFIALMVTSAATLSVLSMLYSVRSVVQLLIPVAMVSALNAYVFGCPAVALLRRWHHRIRHHKTGYSWAWGYYWRLQFHFLFPFLIIVGFLAVIAVIGWISNLVSG